MIKIIDLSRNEIAELDTLSPGWSKRCEAIPRPFLNGSEWLKRKREAARRWKLKKKANNEK